MAKTDAEVFVRSAFDIIGEYLLTDKIVKVKGLGTFKLVTVDSRESVDVNTGERIVIKEHTKVNFTPDPVLRDAVNKPFTQFETTVLYESTDTADMERMDILDLLGENEKGSASGMKGEADSVVSQELEIVSSDEANGTQANTEGDMDEIPIETAAIDEDEDVETEIHEGDAESPDGEASSIPAEEHHGVEGKVENAENETSGNDAEPGTSVGEKTEDESASFLRQNVEEEVPLATQGESFPEEEREENEGLRNEKDTDAGVRHEERIHIATQQIKVLKVEHQTVENQHIVQMMPEHHGAKRVYLTPWMMFFTILLVLLLMSIGYYVGYHHLFYVGKAGESKPEAERSVSMKEKRGRNVASKKSDFARQAQTPETAQEKENKEKTPSDTRDVSVDSDYPQTENGAYEIVGTLKEHLMRRGETLRSLALKYYGSKDFTVYLTTYNKIHNPDIVPEGTRLKIPKLRLKHR